MTAVRRSPAATVVVATTVAAVEAAAAVPADAEAMVARVAPNARTRDLGVFRFGEENDHWIGVRVRVSNGT